MSDCGISTRKHCCSGDKILRSSRLLLSLRSYVKRKRHSACLRPGRDAWRAAGVPQCLREHWHRGPRPHLTCNVCLQPFSDFCFRATKITKLHLEWHVPGRPRSQLQERPSRTTHCPAAAQGQDPHTHWPHTRRAMCLPRPPVPTGHRDLHNRSTEGWPLEVTGTPAAPETPAHPRSQLRAGLAVADLDGGLPQGL